MTGPISPTSGRQTSSVPQRLVLLMAVCTGLSAGSLYYAQPLLASMRHSLHIGTGTAGFIVSITQIGYIAGLLLLVPLGDMFARRRLVPLMAGGLAACLALVSVAPSAGPLLAVSMAVGILSATAQVTVAFAASLASDADRGRIVGRVMSGLLLGILLARTASGYLAELGGWRTPFRVAAVVMAALAVILWRSLPHDPDRVQTPYLKVLISIPLLLREEPVVLVRSLYGAAAFGAFNALWTPLAFLLSGSPYHYATSTIGLFGLLGVAGAAAASASGHVADRGWAPAMTALSSAVMLLSWILIGAGRYSLAALVVGIIVLDFAVQGLHITNQTIIYGVRPEARSRITSAYMSLYFVGGVVGSVGASSAYAAGGWKASSMVGAAFGVVAVALSAVDTLRRRSVRAAVSAETG
ncbi:MAG TPA: MFS transporter [Acidimicrobiales bacterium]|nr:MFS transporter [Acidimicrobiales bacterium]